MRDEQVLAGGELLQEGVDTLPELFNGFPAWSPETIESSESGALGG